MLLNAYMVFISSAFDSGSIDVVDASSAADVQLRLVPEPLCELEGARFMQWFHFKVTNVKGVSCRFRILNAGDVSFASGWEGYKAVCTYDRLSHFRVEGTRWDADAGQLNIELTPEHDTLWLSYFAPFTTERHMKMVTRVGSSPVASLKVLGQSLDGRDIECLTVGHGGEASVWIIAQQHPGEHMAEFWTEGLLDRLVDRSDAVGRALCDLCTFHVVPRINPDGCARGHLRTNAAVSRVMHSDNHACPVAATFNVVFAPVQLAFRLVYVNTRDCTGACTINRPHITMHD